MLLELLINLVSVRINWVKFYVWSSLNLTLVQVHIHWVFRLAFCCELLFQIPYFAQVRLLLATVNHDAICARVLGEILASEG